MHRFIGTMLPDIFSLYFQMTVNCKNKSGMGGLVIQAKPWCVHFRTSVLIHNDVAVIGFDC